jgi:hypothetical protein
MDLTLLKLSTFHGTEKIDGVWQPQVLEVGGTYSYGDFSEFKGQVTEDLKKSLYHLPSLLEGSDYSGGAVELSNHRSFLKDFKEVDGVYNLEGGFGTYSVAIRLDVLESHAEIKKAIKSLADYPLLDDEDYHALQNGWEQEAMADNLWQIGMNISNLDTYIPEFKILLETLLDDTSSIEEFAWDGINELSLDWSYENTSAYMDYERVLPYVEDRLLIKYGKVDTLPLLINREWSCTETKEMFENKLKG